MIETRILTASSGFENNDPKSFQADLPDGQRLKLPNQVQLDVVEGLMAVSRDFPASLDELGRYVYGENYSRIARAFELTCQIGEVKKLLGELGWKVVVGGNSVFWIEKEAEKNSTGIKSGGKSMALTGVGEIPNALQRMLDSVKAKSPDLLEGNGFNADTTNVLAMTSDFQGGIRQIPTDSQIIEEQITEERLKLAKDRLEGLVALSITNPDNPEIRNIYSWGQRLNELMLVLNGQTPGEEVLFEAISSLDDVTRAILLSQISMSKKYEILRVGLPYINEREMASFMNQAIYGLNRALTAQRQVEYKSVEPALIEIQELLLTIVERDESSEDFSASLVLDAVLKYYPGGADYVFQMLIRAGADLNMEADLMKIFASNPKTYSLAQEIHREYFRENAVIDEQGDELDHYDQYLD